MDIPAVSMSLAKNDVLQQASLSVAKKSMDLVDNQMQGLLEMIQPAPAPSFGHTLDIRV